MALVQVMPVLQLVPLSRLKALQYTTKLVLLVIVNASNTDIVPLSVLTSLPKLVLQVLLVSIWVTAQVPVTLVLLVILNNNMLPLL